MEAQNMIDARKKLGLILVAMLVAGSFTANCALAAKTVRWKLPTAFGTALPGLGDQIVEIVEDMKTMSDGQIQVKVFEPKALVPSSGITQAVKDNKLPAGYTWLGYDQGRIPASALIAAGAPFTYDPTEYIAWWYEGGGVGLAEELYAPHNIKPILCGLSGPETGGWYQKELTSIDDFKGLKIRFSGLGGTILQKAGASITMLPGGEIFPALEKGALDATEFATPAVDVKLGFYKVAKYNYFPGWHQPATAFHLIVNQGVWDGLSTSQQSIVENACTSGVLKNLARGEALSGPQIIANKDNGVEVRTFPENILNDLREISKEVMIEQSAKDASFKKIYESQQSFDKTYKEWSKIGYLPR
jgi:TRAP-type mannitol/chloroaromatic compound transport system substrate-binding protein